MTLLEQITSQIEQSNASPSVMVIELTKKKNKYYFNKKFICKESDISK